MIGWTKWSAVAEILSAIAIVVTLAYFALQTRYLAEKTKQARAQTQQNNELLKQTIDVAGIERSNMRSDSVKYWAELIANNADVWTEGLSGEPLNVADAATFDALAIVWYFDEYQSWFSNNPPAKPGAFKV